MGVIWEQVSRTPNLDNWWCSIMASLFVIGIRTDIMFPGVVRLHRYLDVGDRISTNTRLSNRPLYAVA